MPGKIVPQAPRRTKPVTRSQESICGICEKTCTEERFFLALVQELVVKNRSREDRGVRTLRCRLCLSGSGNAPLAEDAAVLLPGDLFRHLEHHLHQRILG